MQIDNLEKSHLVTRQRNLDDRRMITIQLTEDGEQLIQQVLPGKVAAITEELSVLTPEEQQELGDLCRKLGSQDSAAF